VCARSPADLDNTIHSPDPHQLCNPNVITKHRPTKRSDMRALVSSAGALHQPAPCNAPSQQQSSNAPAAAAAPAQQPPSSVHAKRQPGSAASVKDQQGAAAAAEAAVAAVAGRGRKAAAGASAAAATAAGPAAAAVAARGTAAAADSFAPEPFMALERVNGFTGRSIWGCLSACDALLGLSIEDATSHAHKHNHT
jgi:hypothetical protein